MQKKVNNGWRKVKLKEVCREITVGHVGSMANEYVSEGITFLRSQNILPFSLDLSSVKYITPEFHSKLKKSAFSPGDVAVVRTGYPGTACVIPSWLSVSNCADLVIIRPSEEVNSKYLACIFNSTWGQGAVAGNLVGVAQQHFNVSAAKEMAVNLPPRKTQDKIASIIYAYNDLIENNTRRIKILEEMARSLYREWFVNFRFPGHEQVKMVDSELGLIPEGWEVGQLLDFGEVITGKTPSKKILEYYSDYMPFIKTPSMHGNMFCIEVEEYLSELGVGSQKNKILPPNSLLVNCIGALAGSVSMTTAYSQTNQQINAVVLTNQETREFLYFTLVDLKETIRQHGSNGATMINLSKGKFEALRIVYPDKETMSTFHKTTCPQFDLIRNLQIKNFNLRRTRDLLLPKLISGKIDVENLDIETEVTAA